MTVLHRWKKMAVFAMSGLLLCLSCGCGLSQSKADISSEILSTQDKEESSKENYVKDSVVLPSRFDTMKYPMEALAVEYYTQGYAYYRQGGESDSFWFSMAVLSSLLTENGILHPESDDEHYYYTKGEIDALASVLYHDCALDLSQIPRILSDDQYVLFNEEEQKYGLLNGNVGDLGICITRCENTDEGYDIDYQLKDFDSGKVICEYQVSVIPEEHKVEDATFYYSITDFSIIDDGSIAEEDASATQYASAEMDLDMIDGEEIVDDSDVFKDEIVIGQEEALEQAKEYMGEDVKFTYKQLVTIGDYDYYDFAMKGASVKATDILVCINGMDILSGIQHKDGSWSFDQ